MSTYLPRVYDALDALGRWIVPLQDRLNGIVTPAGIHTANLVKYKVVQSPYGGVLVGALESSIDPLVLPHTLLYVQISRDLHTCALVLPIQVSDKHCVDFFLPFQPLYPASAKASLFGRWKRLSDRANPVWFFRLTPDTDPEFVDDLRRVARVGLSYLASMKHGTS